MLKGFAQALRSLWMQGGNRWVRSSRSGARVEEERAPFRWGMHAHDIMTIKDKQHAMA